MKRKFNAGDLCVVDGYGDRVWEVEGFTLEFMYLRGQYAEEIIYNLKCILTNERVIAYQSDVILVCRAAYAYDYLRQLDESGRPPKSTVNIAREEDENMEQINEWRIPHVYPNTRDGLLEELADLLTVVKVIGEADEYLQNRIDKVKNKLKAYQK